MRQIFLHEWQWVELPAEINPAEFQEYLHQMWLSKNNLFDYEDQVEAEEDISDLQRYKQGFIRFDGNYISPKNYVGFIQFNGLGINILPKVCLNSYPDPQENNISEITSHLLEWLSYSRRIRFPFSKVSFEGQDFERILEPFIHIFSEVTNNLLEKIPYQKYEELTETTAYLKGRLDINKYINESLTSGKFHQIISTYDSFEFNNSFNQIVKFVTKILLRNTSNGHNIRKLQNILFLLNEVEDKSCFEQDCDKVFFNKVYRQWETVLNMCRLFLSGQSFRNQQLNKSNFCFLVPMEIVFEEYAVGILEKYGSAEVLRQPSSRYLTETNLFRLKPDIIYDNSVIIDTKYKLINEGDYNSKLGVAQSDLYQMLAYATRYKKNKIVLLYPDTKLESHLPFINRVEEFLILNEFTQNRISIWICQIKIFRRELLQCGTSFFN